jgi:hypothetical protein
MNAASRAMLEGDDAVQNHCICVDDDVVTYLRCPMAVAVAVADITTHVAAATFDADDDPSISGRNQHSDQQP